jgi:Mg2+-importing ATPase
VEALSGLGVRLVLITGDALGVAARIARDVTGRDDLVVERGERLRGERDLALPRLVEGVDVWAEVEPNDKQRIVRALRRAGHVVAYIGDGINDVPPLHAADVGISVDSAADVAKAEADVVMLDPDLADLVEGIREGRRTFANTLKYVAYTSSANFGNMVSMGLGVPFLPFLPLLPTQILLNNFLSDVPSLMLSSDAVGEDATRAPERWDLHRLRSFMFVFGGLSSVFDLATFAALLALPGSTPERFRTGWFVESVLTEVWVLLVLRTRRASWTSRPSRGLLLASLVTTLVVLALPWIPQPFSLVPLPARDVTAVLLLVIGYLGVTELAKGWFYRKERAGTVP